MSVLSELKIVMGLGNPGSRYERTRHNVGFDAIDRLAHTYKIPVRQVIGRSWVGAGRIDSEEIVLAKPKTYMNRSGDAAVSLLEYYGQGPSQLIVIHDDLDLDLGRVRIKRRGGHGGHRGLESILEALGTNEFIRIKIGIARPRGEATDYVLESFSRSEHKVIAEILDDIIEIVRLLVEGRVDRAMNQFHHGNKKED